MQTYPQQVHETFFARKWFLLSLGVQDWDRKVDFEGIDALQDLDQLSAKSSIRIENGSLKKFEIISVFEDILAIHWQFKCLFVFQIHFSNFRGVIWTINCISYQPLRFGFREHPSFYFIVWIYILFTIVYCNSVLLSSFCLVGLKSTDIY